VKVKYDPDSGAAYIRLRDRPVVETEEVAPGVLMDLAEDGRPVGFDILDAAAIMDVPRPQGGAEGVFARIPVEIVYHFWSLGHAGHRRKFVPAFAQAWMDDFPTAPQATTREKDSPTTR
jgi:uncharacterized protein YuzE